MAAPDRKSRYKIVVAVHHPLVVNQVIEHPKNLQDLLVLCFFRVFRHAHLKVYLLLQGLGIEVVEEGRLIVLVDVLDFFDVLAQRVPPSVQRSASRIQIDTVERASVMPQQQIEHADPLSRI